MSKMRVAGRAFCVNTGKTRSAKRSADDVSPRGQMELPHESDLDHFFERPVKHYHTFTMRLPRLLTAALLPFTALAAKKSTGDRYNDYHSKQVSSLAPIKLDDVSYNEMTKVPRDYSVAVLLTALDARFGCQLCHDFQPEWDLLARSWTKGDKQGDSRLVYATLDFSDGKQTFQSV